jgi:uncharacterized protein YidB (DUF937 family)
MGLLDSVLKNPDMVGNLARLAGDNPQLAEAAMSLLSSREGTPGGTAGLAGIVGALQGSGLDDIVSSWLGGGENKAISPQQVESALGSDTLGQFAKQAGIDSGQASSLLAGLLPQAIDKLSPDGKLPDMSGIESQLGGLLGSLTR